MKSRRIQSALIVIMTMFVVVNCGDDDNATGPDNGIPAGLIATWTYQSATISDIPVSLELVLQWHDGTVSARFMVSADGTFINQELDSDDMVIWTESGTFSVSGNNATITITSDSDGPVDPPDIMSGTWALDGNELTLTTTMEGYRVVIVATK
jgi:hypothetical protein